MKNKKFLIILVIILFLAGSIVYLYSEINNLAQLNENNKQIETIKIGKYEYFSNKATLDYNDIMWTGGDGIECYVFDVSDNMVEDICNDKDWNITDENSIVKLLLNDNYEYEPGCFVNLSIFYDTDYEKKQEKLKEFNDEIEKEILNNSNYYYFEDLGVEHYSLKDWIDRQILDNEYYEDDNYECYEVNIILAVENAKTKKLYYYKEWF